VQAGRLSGIVISDDVAVETVDGLTLILGGLELGRVQPQSVVWAARVFLIRSVQQCSGAPPTSIHELLVEGRRQGCCDGIIGITCRRQVLDITMGMGREQLVDWTVGWWDDGGGGQLWQEV
jgi:hypothetical protein